MYLPNREELLLLTVFALPNASSSGLDESIHSLTRVTSALLPLTLDMYCIMSFDVSVLPLPLSPLRSTQRGVRRYDDGSGQVFLPDNDTLVLSEVHHVSVSFICLE